MTNVEPTRLICLIICLPARVPCPVRLCIRQGVQTMDFSSNEDAGYFPDHTYGHVLELVTIDKMNTDIIQDN